MDDTSQTATPAADAPKPTAPANGERAERKDDPARLPADHPLVTAFERQKEENAALREKAKRLDEIEDAKKSVEERAAERMAEAKRKEEAIPSRVAEALKAHLIALHSISEDDADLYLTASDPDRLIKQAKGIVERQKQRPGYVPTQGTATPADVEASSYEMGRAAAQARYHVKN